MNKREERDHKFRLLFSTQFYPGDEIPEQLKHYFCSPDYDDGETCVRIEGLDPAEEAGLVKDVEEIVRRIPELDRMIDEGTAGWKTSRMSKTDLCVLRLGLYEIRFDEDVPERVAINEAVELAKKYGGAESGAFVNGVLARLVDETRRNTEVQKEQKPFQKTRGSVTEKRREDKRVHVLVNTPGKS